MEPGRQYISRIHKPTTPNLLLPAFYKQKPGNWLLLVKEMPNIPQGRVA